MSSGPHKLITYIIFIYGLSAYLSLSSAHVRAALFRKVMEIDLVKCFEGARGIVVDVV